MQIRQGSVKNRRLAIQMANRPSVINALRGNPNLIQNRGIKQRLGNPNFGQNNNNNNNNNRNINRRPNIRRNNNPLNRNRINVNVKRNFNRFNANNALNNRNNNNNFNVNNRNRNIQNRIRNNVQRTGRQLNNNRSQNISVITGVRNVRRNPTTAGRINIKRTPGIRVGFKQRRRLTGGQMSQPQNNRQVGGRKFRINRNFNARNNARNNLGQRRGRKNVAVNREQLDTDLDTYMSGTRTQLDAELDAYMCQT